MLDDLNGTLARAGKLEKAGPATPDGTTVRQSLAGARLPVMPQVLSRLLDACLAGDPGTDELAAIVSLDPAIAAQVIAVASAAVSDERTRLANLTQCVGAVGPGVIRNIAGNESAARVFGQSSEGQESVLAHAWSHALKSALLAKALAAAMGYPETEEAYLAGLMHDIGSLALAATDPTGYPQLLYQGRDDEAQCRLELERYRVTHAEVGSTLAEKWRLGTFLSDSILYHHAPAERVASAHPLIRIVLLANHLAHLGSAADLGEAGEFARRCGAPADCLAPALERADAEMGRIAAELGIAPEAGGARAKLSFEPGSMRDRGIGELQARLEKRVLIDAAQCLLDPLVNPPEAAEPDAGLKAIAQAGLVLLGLQPAVFFLREGQSDAYAGRAILSRHAKANQLRFQAGQADSAASMAVSGTPAIWFDHGNWQTPLDSQLARLLQAEGVVCIPIGAGPDCRGLLVAALHSQAQADQLNANLDLLRAFGALARGLLDGALAQPDRGSGGTAAEIGATREQIQHLLHEVSTPLTTVRNYLATLQVSLGENPAAERQLHIVAEEIGRVSQILDQLQQGPRASADSAELQELVQGILDLCTGSGLAPPAVRIETSFLAAAPAIVAHPDKLKQVLLNLMKNAFEAMPAGGVLRVSTSGWSDGGASRHVEIMLEDTGPGLPEEIRRNMYQPVTSTKGGRHFGIGLSIAGQLIREMHGLINCHSDQNGCRFRIILPLETR